MKKIKKIICLFSILSFFSIFRLANYELVDASTYVKSDASSDIKLARLFFAGDVLPHINFDNYARNYGNGDYNYERSFERLFS